MQKSIITAALITFSFPAVAQQTITCSSTNGRQNFCPANTQNGVVLLQEHSDGVCEQGSTWSYTRRGISVSGGCSADFQINRSTGDRNRSQGNDGYGNNADNYNQNSNSNNRNNSYGNNDSGYGDNANGHRNSNNSDGYRQGGPVIPSGTRMDVRLDQAVNISEVNKGELIPGSLVNGVSVNGREIAPAGTSVQAKIMSQRGAPLDLRLDSMTVNGLNYRLVTNSVHSAKDSQGGQNANSGTAGEQIGSIIGSLAGGGQLPNGSVYTFRLTSPARPMNSNQY
jgi:hypothetical protein